jgi:hypothetical protein
MEIQDSMRDGCLVVSLTGSIDLFSVSHIQRTLVKHLGEQPYALICDLSGVAHLDPVCAWRLAAHRGPRRQPAAPAPGPPDVEDERGRGLWLVEQLARA